MAKTVFWGSIIMVWVVFFIAWSVKPLTFRHWVIILATLGYTLLYDVLLGGYLHLYYYIQPNLNLLYIVFAGVLIYPWTNAVYALFLPIKWKSILVYTLVWIVIMMIWEYINIASISIVFTGWHPIPWSIVTYIGTYAWVILLMGYMRKKGIQ